MKKQKRNKLKELSGIITTDMKNSKRISEGILDLILTTSKLKNDNKKYRKKIKKQQNEIDKLTKIVSSFSLYTGISDSYTEDLDVIHKRILNSLQEKNKIIPASLTQQLDLSKIEVKNPDAVRYGIKIDKTKKAGEDGRVEYILNASGFTPAKMNFETGKFDYGSWKDKWFVEDNKPVLLSFDGTEEKELNPNDYSKFANGKPVLKAPYASLESYVKRIKGNFMSKIPLTYLCEYEDERYMYIIVSDKEYDSSYIPVAHMNENKEVMDYIYLAMFKGFVDENGRLRSIPSCTKYNIIPTGGDDAYTEVQAAKNNDLNVNGYNVRTWGQRQLINALLMIMSCSENSKESFGHGNNCSGDKNCTGVLKDKGQFFGMDDDTTSVKVFHMEDWWGNMWECIVGCLCSHNEIMISLTGPYNFTGEGYVKIHMYQNDDSDYILKFKATEYGLIPIEVTNDIEDSICGGEYLYLWDGEEITVALVGGNCCAGAHGGASCLSLTATPFGTYWDLGACLSFIKTPSRG